MQFMLQDFDPLSAAFAQDPYPIYASLRNNPTPFYFSNIDAHLLSRFDDVDQAARNPRMLRSNETFTDEATRRKQQQERNWHDMPNHERFVQFSMLETDGEVHRRLRMLLLRSFSKTLIAKQRDMIQIHVDHLLDELLEQGEFDFVEDFAAKVPGHVIGQVLGVPAEDCPQLRTWSEEIVQFFDVDRTPEDKLLAETAATQFYEFLSGLIAERRKTPRDDLLTVMVQAQAEGQMSETELVSSSLLVLAGGHGSTIDVLGTGMLAFFNFPGQLQLLREDPGLIHSAVQEMFRYDSPLPFFHRYASEEVTICGQAYPIGTKFGLLYGAANRDPAVYSDPDNFDITRVPNRHLAFGRGAHLCLGNNLARLDMELVFLTLLRRTETIEQIEVDPEFRRGISARGLKSLRVRTTAN
jgi:cytochrome P450